MDLTLYWFMFPVSILVATCAMLSGIGGAALFTPIFVLVFPLLGAEYPLETTIAAIASALLTQTFGFLSGFLGYLRRGLIDFLLAGRFIRIAVPVAVTGALVGGAVHDSILLASYAALVAVLSFTIQRPGNPDAAAVRPAVGGQARSLTDAAGRVYHFPDLQLTRWNYALTGIGAFTTGLVSVGIGEVTISQLTHRGVPIAVAAATSVLTVIVTVLFASLTLVAQLIESGGWSAVPWNLVCYTIPGVLIGGQIGPRLQGHVSQTVMRRAIGVLFFCIAVAMFVVAWRKLG